MTVQQKATGEAIERLLKRGVAQIEKEADLHRLLLEGNKGQPLRVKLGVDPSHYDLTIGHAVVFHKLRQFQQSFTLPAAINPERAEASYADGILTLNLPKAERMV